MMRQIWSGIRLMYSSQCVQYTMILIPAVRTISGNDKTVSWSTKLATIGGTFIERWQSLVWINFSHWRWIVSAWGWIPILWSGIASHKLRRRFYDRFSFCIFGWRGHSLHDNPVVLFMPLWCSFNPFRENINRQETVCTHDSFLKTDPDFFFFFWSDWSGKWTDHSDGTCTVIVAEELIVIAVIE